jgi:thiol-disulfide isomerase/thioredoxin
MKELPSSVLRLLALVAVAASILVAGACSREAAKPAASGSDTPTSWTGDYRAALQLPGGELPFGLSITEEDGKLVGWIINGRERLRIDETSVTDGQLLLRMPGFENRITARREGGQLLGELYMVKARDRHQRIPFTALRGAPVRFFPRPEAPGGDVSGRWATTFTDDEGGSYNAVGEFVQDGSDVTGTFLTPTGDYRYLSGEMRGGRLYLSTFNGGQAFLFHGGLSGDGATLNGDYWSGLAWHETFAARRDEQASLGEAAQLTTVRDPNARFEFTFPDLTGKPVSFSDPQFRDRVVIVVIGGSWCANCHDEVALLTALREKYGPEGLEVVGLMFEQLDDVAEAREAVARFRDRWNIPYPLLLTGTTTQDPDAPRLPQLDAIRGYPTTIFIDRKGMVRHIHTGFSGPATGEHYTELARDFEERVRTLLAEKA